MPTNFGITAGELKRQIEHLNDDDELFLGGLTFNRFKRKGDKLVQLEFIESVYEGEDGKIVVIQDD